MAVDFNGIVHNVIMGLTDHVFGNVVVTCSVLLAGIVLFALLIQIPLPFALAIPIPIAIVLAAYGYLLPLAAGLLAAVFLILSSKMSLFPGMVIVTRSSLFVIILEIGKSLRITFHSKKRKQIRLNLNKLLNLIQLLK